MKLKLALLLFIFFTSNSYSALRWTDDNWRGRGVSVTNVYLQWDQHWVQFYGGNGKSYYYYWGEQEEPNEKAKMLFTMLLTAFTANKKVSVAYDTTPDEGGRYAFSYLNLHN